jgi:hypothetical protein
MKGELYPMPTIRKHDRKRPWKKPATRAKNSPGDGVRRFKPSGAPSLGWEGRPSGSDMDPRLKTAAWRKAREAILADDPLCPICAHQGRATAAAEVDHIEPRASAPERFFDRLNLWGLCRACHFIKTRMEWAGATHTERDEWIDAVTHHKKPKQ